MKKSFVTKGFIAILIVFIFALMAVGCGDNNNNNLADKTALNTEISLEITEEGDYTEASYSVYVAKLAEAKAVANNASATQNEVDGALSALKEARIALAIKDIDEVEGGKKLFNLLPNESKEIALTDYINANGLSKITYKIKTSNAVVSISPITDGKFTITAGEIRKPTDLTVSIIACYDGVEKLKVELSVHISNDVTPTLKNEEIVKKYDLLILENKESIILDFSENINNSGNLEIIYSVKCGDNDLNVDGSLYTYTLDSYTDEFVYTTFTVTALYTVNGEKATLEYTYKLAIRDTGVYGVANGNFENGLDGWTLVGTVGESPFGGVDNKTTFWGEGYAMNNIGSYFSSYADGAEETSQGTLASPYFTAKSEYATYMLGGAGNRNVYITIENKSGDILAIYRNTKFADFPEGDFSVEQRREMIGNTVFLANLVTYKVDLSAFSGQEIRFVIHDYASSEWGVVFFDELITYYSSEDDIPENAVLAENLLANKDELNSEIALGITEKGDYTDTSYNAYAEKLEAAKSIVSNINVDQTTVDEMVKELKAARLALTVRPIEELKGATKAFKLPVGNIKEIVLTDYVNTNGLSKISYEIKSNNSAVTLGSLVDGKFTITAGEVSNETDVTVSIDVFYDGNIKLTVTLSIKVTNDQTPTVLVNELIEEYDVYALENKTSIVLDLSKNIDNTANIKLNYSVNYNGEDITLSDSLYTFTFDKYSETTTNEIITVTVSYELNEQQKTSKYTYNLAMKDTGSYRLANGGFENGLTGWDKVGNIGDVSTDTNYWTNEWENDGKGYLFGMDGEKMFSAYAPGAEESAVGTLTSSTFTVGGSGFVTFKLGAMKDGNYVYVDVVDAKTKNILARYYNGLWAEYTDEIKSGCTLIAYKADLSAFIGKDVFFRVSDNADSGYGLFFLDSFNTYYETEPDGFNAATSVNYEVTGTIYDLFNGGFELGDVQGWWNNGEPGHVTDADAFFSGAAYGKDGNYLYSGVEDFEAGNGKEGNRGVLTSSMFEIGGTGYISFMLGGGDNVLCYIQVIDSTTGEILARYHQQAMQDAVLVQYVADLSAYIGRTARIQVVDQADRNWGCVSFDNVITYYAKIEDLPNGLEAKDIKGDIKYTVENGSFETGDLDGWTMHITEAGAHNTLGWILDTEIDAGWYTKNNETKDGNYLFTFVKPDDTNCENTKGTLQSSTFTLKQGSFVSFMFGGAGGTVNHDVYVELCRADGSVIATFYNDAEGKINTKMNAYYFQYNGVEVECFFKVVDNSTNDYGCFVVDNFRVNLESVPEGYIAANQ